MPPLRVLPTDYAVQYQLVPGLGRTGQHEKPQHRFLKLESELGPLRLAYHFQRDLVAAVSKDGPADPPPPMGNQGDVGLDRTSFALARLLDHLVGASEEHGWRCEAQLICSFEVEHKLKLRWLLNR